MAEPRCISVDAPPFLLPVSAVVYDGSDKDWIWLESQKQKTRISAGFLFASAAVFGDAFIDLAPRF